MKTPHLNLLTTTTTTTLLFLLLLLLTTPSTASSFSPPPLFCKCTCGTNSTIIPLDERPASPSILGSSSSGLRSRHWQHTEINPNLYSGHLSIFRRDGGEGGSGTAHTCADCTRSFCLGYNLPFCKGVQKEEDVVTSCFARDGVMDRVLVWGFVVVTVGLLVWAGVRGWVLERVRGFGGGARGWLGGGEGERGRYEGLGRG